jgi:hypothetical protein
MSLISPVRKLLAGALAVGADKLMPDDEDLPEGEAKEEAGGSEQDNDLAGRSEESEDVAEDEQAADDSADDSGDDSGGDEVKTMVYEAICSDPDIGATALWDSLDIRKGEAIEARDALEAEGRIEVRSGSGLAKFHSCPAATRYAAASTWPSPGVPSVASRARAAIGRWMVSALRLNSASGPRDAKGQDEQVLQGPAGPAVPLERAGRRERRRRAHRRVHPPQERPAVRRGRPLPA